MSSSINNSSIVVVSDILEVDVSDALNMAVSVGILVCLGGSEQ